MYDALINREKSIAIIDLGYVGLPLELGLARYFRVVGFGISAERVAVVEGRENPSNDSYRGA